MRRRFVAGIAAGALETIFGANLAGGARVAERRALPVLYGSDAQINFYVPAETPLGPATLTVTAPSGEQALADRRRDGRAARHFHAPSSPATFVDSTARVCTVPPRAVGLLGADARRAATPSSLVSPGVYRVRVRIPAGLAPGPQTVLLSVNLQHSNSVQITVP